MKRTLVILGLNKILIDIDSFVRQYSLVDSIRIRQGATEFVEELRKLKEKHIDNLDFCIVSNLEMEIVQRAIQMIEAEDIIEPIELLKTDNFFTNSIYHSIWHIILGYKTKRIFDIDDYDRVILIDSIGKQSIDFLNLKIKLYFNKDSELDLYRKRLWCYIHGKNFRQIKRDLSYALEKNYGVIIK